jgi:hypothetical protein
LGRFVPCLYDYFIYDGLRYSPEELAEWHLKGVAGYKIWRKRPLQPSASYSDPMFFGGAAPNVDD